MGTLYGVSVGAGDPGLMTVKAVRILESCGVIAVPRTHGENSLALSIAEQAADLSGKRKVYLDLPMCRDREALDRNYDETAEMLCGLLENEDVAVPHWGIFPCIPHSAALRSVLRNGASKQRYARESQASALLLPLSESPCVWEASHCIYFPMAVRTLRSSLTSGAQRSL